MRFIKELLCDVWIAGFGVSVPGSNFDHLRNSFMASSMPGAALVVSKGFPTCHLFSGWLPKVDDWFRGDLYLVPTFNICATAL